MRKFTSALALILFVLLSVAAAPDSSQTYSWNLP